MKRISIIVAALALCTMATSSYAALGLEGIGARIGSVDPEGVSSTFHYGLILDLGTVSDHISLESYAGYWKKSEEFFGVGSSLSDLMFGAKGRYLFDTSSPTVKPFVGAGLGLHFVTAEVSFQPLYFGVPAPSESVSETEAQPGLDLGGGLQLDNGGQFAFMGELWYSIVPDASQLAFTAGIIYKFGR